MYCPLQLLLRTHNSHRSPALLVAYRVRVPTLDKLAVDITILSTLTWCAESYVLHPRGLSRCCESLKFSTIPACQTQRLPNTMLCNLSRRSSCVRERKSQRLQQTTVTRAVQATRRQFGAQLLTIGEITQAQHYISSSPCMLHVESACSAGGRSACATWCCSWCMRCAIACQPLWQQG
jgi:hypothetical protein